MDLNVYECPYLQDITDPYCNLFKGYRNCKYKECEVLRLIQENKLLKVKIELMKCRQNCMYGFEEKCKHRRCDPCSEWKLKEE